MVAKTIELEKARIAFRADGIVQVTYKEGVKIDSSLQRQVKRTVKEFSPEPVKKFMIFAEDFVSTEKRFWACCKKAENFAKGQMTAVVAPSFAVRILARNYMTIYKPKNPYRIFGEYEDAVAWLNGGTGAV
jgi:hypothetical protein